MQEPRSKWIGSTARDVGTDRDISWKKVAPQRHFGERDAVGRGVRGARPGRHCQTFGSGNDNKGTRGHGNFRLVSR